MQAGSRGVLAQYYCEGLVEDVKMRNDQAIKAVDVGSPEMPQATAGQQFVSQRGADIASAVGELAREVAIKLCLLRGRRSRRTHLVGGRTRLRSARTCSDSPLTAASSTSRISAVPVGISSRC